MHVAEELPSWPESKDRQRVWCSIAEATRQCKHQWMREALQLWVRRKGWEGVLDEQQMANAPPAPAVVFGSSSAHFGGTGNGTANGGATVYELAAAGCLSNST
ncbi:hypothetical protein HYH03_016574 [Edaphochlamys debaryana]|uniref:Uncharacterized protein n=1 Tax=Edaphochlamys debaryana TaxID=47281 RepID=A0A835XJN3_9CHLO|nr:hypothetical protein HYH03_016574 [Edaphochlamys debaryana]|eukprot:KAG2484620.1 hypothetical protein HYH03_016574 [Edaphochlamys debaryana]